MNARYRERSIIMSLLVILVSAAGLWAFSAFSKREEVKIEPIPALTSQEIRNPEIARKYGIKGYLEIELASGSSFLSIRKGEEAMVAIQLRFVSYVTEVSELEVSLDPAGGRGLKIEQVSPGGKSSVNINELVSYNPASTVRVKAGQTIQVTMVIRIPKDYPLSSFPLGAMGIYADIPIIDSIHMEVRAV